MKIFITGVAGFIGSRLANYILENHPEHEVWGVDDMSGGFIWNIPAGVHFANSNIVPLRRHFEMCKPDVVYHAAAYAAEGLSPFIRKYNYTNNVVFTAEITNLCIEYNVKRLIFFSSIAVYGNTHLPPFKEMMQPTPIDPYGIAKYTCEMDIRIAGEQHGLDWVIFRPANVYGPHQNIWDNYRNVLGIWALQALEGKKLRVFGDGSCVRAFTYIDDILKPLYRASYDAVVSKQIFNIMSNIQCSVMEAAEMMSNLTGAGIEVVESRHEVKYAYADSSHAEDLLWFNPKTPLSVGMERMWTWAKQVHRWPEQRNIKLWSPEYEITTGMYHSWQKK